MATATYCDWQACKLRIAASLLVPVANLPAQYDDAISQACRDAAAEIKRIFILKGYSSAQLTQSDDVRVWNEQLGAWFAACRLCGQAGWDLKSFEALNCIERMEKASALVINDQATAPGVNASPVGGVSSGRIDAVDHEFRRLRSNRGWGRRCW